MQTIRKHLNPATVIACLALVFALTGGAFAATSNNRSSGAKPTASTTTLATTSKTKPKPKPKTGARGPAGPAGKNGIAGATGPVGPAGPAGPTGTTGPQGPQGPAGTSGTNGEKGEKGEKGAIGTKGAAGSPWVAGGTLPSGSTEKGAWSVTGMPDSVAGGLIIRMSSPISFTIPLATAPTVHIIAAGEHGLGGKTCPTTSDAENPEAEPGNLCIFVGTEENVGKSPASSGSYGSSNPATGAEGADDAGTVLVVFSSKDEGMNAQGTWAVTAE
jgi:hypothetical protein